MRPIGVAGEVTGVWVPARVVTHPTSGRTARSAPDGDETITLYRDH